MAKAHCCDQCGKLIKDSDIRITLDEFCKSCGAPLTDEAAQMVMERWKEALENG